MIYLQKRLITFLAMAFLLLLPVGLSLAEKASTPAPKTAVAVEKTSARKLREVEKKLVRIETIIEERGKDARLSDERIMDLEQIKSDQAGLREKVSAHHDFTTQILTIAGAFLTIVLAFAGITFKIKADSAVKEAKSAVMKAETSLKEIEQTLEKAKSLKGYIEDLSKKSLQLCTDLSEQSAKAKAAQDKPYKLREEIEQEQKSLKDFEQLARISDVPLPASHYFNLAYNSAALGKKQEAVELYTKAIELKPDYAEGFNNRGVLFVNLGKNDKAMRDFDKAIGLKPDYAEAYINRGLLFKNLGKNDKAMRDYNKAIELEPDFALAYNNRGTLFAKLKKNEEAASDYNKAIDLKPDYAEAYINRGNLFADLGKAEEAMQDYNKAIELDSNLALAHGNRCLLHKELGNKKEAASDYKRAIRLDPSLKDTLEDPDK